MMKIKEKRKKNTSDESQKNKKRIKTRIKKNRKII
jgi:hypothetical protein